MDSTTWPETCQITVNPILFTLSLVPEIEWVNIASHYFPGDVSPGLYSIGYGSLLGNVGSLAYIASLGLLESAKIVKVIS